MTRALPIPINFQAKLYAQHVLILVMDVSLLLQPVQDANQDPIFKVAHVLYVPTLVKYVQALLIVVNVEQVLD